MRARLEQMPRASRATPEAVAWAQARHLIELQLEAIENGVVTASQAFGGLAVTNGGRTVAELLDSAIRRGSPGEPTLLLPGGAEE